MFLIYINNIFKDIYTNVRLFADDTSLYIIVDTPVIAAQKHNADLSKIHNWATRWLVTFNPSKDYYIQKKIRPRMIIYRKRSIAIHPSFVMNNQQIQEVESHKHLGLVFSKDGTWHDHITLIKNKACGRINVIQLEAAKTVTGTTKLVSSLSLYPELGWESIGSRRRKHKLILFYKMFNGLSPDHLDQLMPSQVSHASSYNLRNSDYLTVRTNTKLYYNSFLPSENGIACQIRAEVRPHLKLSFNRDTVNKPFYYYIGERLGQIYHARHRTECSSLNENLFRKDITTDPNCVCGAVETTKHFLLECNALNEIRQEMLNKIRSFCTPTLDYLLYGADALFFFI